MLLIVLVTEILRPNQNDTWGLAEFGMEMADQDMDLEEYTPQTVPYDTRSLCS